MGVGVSANPRGARRMDRGQHAVAFSDGEEPGEVTAHIAAVMAAHGWVRHDVATARDQGKIAHWTLAFRGRPPANAFAFTTPAHSHQWFITANWTPSGTRAGGCP